MRIRHTCFLPFILIAVASTLFAVAADQGKIPITTSSDKALKAYLTGRDLAEKLRATDSIQYFDEAITADPNMAVAYLMRAQVQPTTTAFFEDMKKAQALAPRVSEGEQIWIAGVQALADGFPQKQKESFESLVAKFPNDERAHNLLGGTYFALRRFDLAAEQYSKAIAINPDFTLPYNMLGYSDRSLEKFDESAKAFRKYIELIPNDPNPYDSYAELLQKLGRYDESITNYRKALELDPHFLSSRLGIATDLNFKDEYVAARSEIQKILETARNDGERRAAYFGLAVSYSDEGNMQKAVEAMQQSFTVAQNGKDTASMAADVNTMGTILLDAGHSDEALSKFDQGYDLIAKSSLSEDVKRTAKQTHLSNQTQVYVQKKELDSAQSAADEFRKQAQWAKNPLQISQSHQLDGMIALAKKNYDTAIEQLRQANLQDPYNLYRLGLAYEGKGDSEKAQELFRKSANFNGLNNIQMSLVRAKANKAIAPASAKKSTTR
jgi:tetratricopeptide (TPR) repeat protein